MHMLMPIYKVRQTTHPLNKLINLRLTFRLNHILFQKDATRTYELRPSGETSLHHSSQ